MKKKIKIGKILLYAMLLLIACTLIYINPKSDNVFEEIYYDRTRQGWKMHNKVSSLYINLDTYKYYPQILNILSPWDWKTRDNDWCCDTYFFRESDTILIIYYKNDKRIDFIRTWDDPTDTYQLSKIYMYSYDLDTKELSYGGNVPGEMDTFLFDIILTDWFTCNSETSNFSMDDLGEYKDMGRTLTKEKWEQSFLGSSTYPGEWNPETDE